MAPKGFVLTAAEKRDPELLDNRAAKRQRTSDDVLAAAAAAAAQSLAEGGSNNTDGAGDEVTEASNARSKAVA